MNLKKIFTGVFLALALAIPSFAQGLHWNKNMIMVYMPAADEYTPMMQKAFKDWEGHFERKILYIMTTFYRDVRLADIEVRLNPVTGEGAKNSGNTALIPAADFIRHGVITINYINDEEIQSNPEKKAQNDAEIYRVMQHEVGKVMGLQNSDNINSVMFNKIEKGQSILPEDVQNLYVLYGWRATQTKSR